MGAKQNKENLEEIISSLADARLNDKKDLVVLGAKFEEFISGFNSQNLGQLQKLTNISWKGFKYLYSEVEYFMSIKSAMIQALNTIHEYLVNDDIEVKDFEKSYDDLSDVLKRGLSEVGEEDAETTENGVQTNLFPGVKQRKHRQKLIKNQKNFSYRPISILQCWPNLWQNVPNYLKWLKGRC